MLCWHKHSSAVVLHWVQKLWLPCFEPLCSPPRNTAKQDDVLGCPWWVRLPFSKHESWRRQGGDGQDTGSQEFLTQYFYLSNFHFQDSGCWNWATAVSVLCCICGVCEKAPDSTLISYHMPGHLSIPNIQTNYISHFYYSDYYSANTVILGLSHFWPRGLRVHKVSLVRIWSTG